MNNFMKYLKDLGYKGYRKIPKKTITKKIYQENGDFSVEKIIRFDYTCDKNIGGFSSMASGGIDIRFIKDDVEIVLGLNEKGQPPTLIYPRPFVIGNNSKFINCAHDYQMNRILANEIPQDIYKAMFSLDDALKVDYID